MSGKKVQFGGSFAPPITAQTLASYKQLASEAPIPRIREEMTKLIAMVEHFQKTPESKLAAKPHPSGSGKIVPLEDVEIKRIWDNVPYEDECDVIGRVFDVLRGDIRNAAYHLLWYARELTQDREPITTDKL